MSCPSAVLLAVDIVAPENGATQTVGWPTSGSHFAPLSLMRAHADVRPCRKRHELDSYWLPPLAVAAWVAKVTAKLLWLLGLNSARQCQLHRDRVSAAP